MACPYGDSFTASQPRRGSGGGVDRQAHLLIVPIVASRMNGITRAAGGGKTEALSRGKQKGCYNSSKRGGELGMIREYLLSYCTGLSKALGACLLSDSKSSCIFLRTRIRKDARSFSWETEAAGHQPPTSLAISTKECPTAGRSVFEPFV